LINSDRPVTGGNFQNLTVRVPTVSIFNAQEPSPCQWYYTPLGLLIDLVQKALAPAAPDRVAAAHFGDSMIVSFAAEGDADSNGFAYIAAELGGWGAFSGGDGQDCMINVINGDFKTLPVEFVESHYPLTILEWSLREDSGGPGAYRGGAGSRKVFRVERDGVAFSCWLDRTRTPAWGLFGGGEARSSRAIVNEGRAGERVHNKVTNLPLRRGDTVTLYTGGGGGYGPAVERHPSLLRRDLENGYISAAHAREAYGVEKISSLNDRGSGTGETYPSTA
jgi:N-methylhydantoinase B